MRKSSLLLYIFALAFIFGLANVIATRFYLFWTTWWADKMMHLIGGTVLAMFAVWLAYSFAARSLSKKRDKLFWISFLFVMAIMIVWKFLEQKFGINDSTQSHSVDFVLDFVSTALGACIGWLYATGKRFRLHE